MLMESSFCFIIAFAAHLSVGLNPYASLSICLIFGPSVFNVMLTQLFRGREAEPLRQPCMSDISFSGYDREDNSDFDLLKTFFTISRSFSANCVITH